MTYSHRCWHPCKREMLYSEHGEVARGNKTPDNPEWSWMPVVFDFNCDNVEHDLVLMQSTGLKDKNGKEIFDGDIIRVPYYEFTRTEKVEIIKADDVYECHPFNWYNQERDGYGYPSDSEIIGNIYEHPDLLP
jgi:uncharacterized phage protein (TIGR01671 family)